MDYFDLERLHVQATQHLQAGDLPQAHELCRQILSAAPHHDRSLGIMGVIALQQGQLEESVDFLRRAIKVAGLNSAYRLNLAQALAQLNRLDEALAAVRHAISLKPEFGEAHAVLGRILRHQRHFAEATTAFELAAGLRPELPQHHCELGMVLEDQCRYEEAVTAFERALAVKPDYAEAANGLGNVLQSLRRHQDALESYRRAASICPDAAEVHANIGSLLQRDDRFPEAVAAFERAIDLDSTFGNAHYLLATAKLGMGEVNSALECTERCLALDPHAQDALALKALLLWELGEQAAARHLVDLERYIYIERLEAPRGYASIAQFNDALERHVLEHAALTRDPFGASTRGGRHSDDIFARPKGPAVDLKRMLKAGYQRYLETLPVDPSHPFLSRAPERYQLLAQANILDSQGYLIPHIHPHAWVSGAYYVRIPEVIKVSDNAHAGWIEFGRAPDTIQTKVVPDLRCIQPEEGTLVLFPSYFYHGTIPFESGVHRMSLGTDVVVEG